MSMSIGRKKVPDPSRLEELRALLQERASGAGHRIQCELDDRVPRVKASVGGAAHAAADTAQAVAGTAQAAASTAVDTVYVRSRPIVEQSAVRGSAAWSALRYGPGSRKSAASGLRQIIAYGVASTPVVGKSGSALKSRAGSTAVLAAAGGVTAVGILWWRRSRAGDDTLWITEPGEPGESEKSGRYEAPVKHGKAGASDKPADCVDPETYQDPAHTWP